MGTSCFAGCAGLEEMTIPESLTFVGTNAFARSNVTTITVLGDPQGLDSAFYNSLTAVKEGKVYSQISFRYCASNLDTALADAYYAATILYPEQFADVDLEAKIGDIVEIMETRPLSATKRFRLVKIVEKAVIL